MESNAQFGAMCCPKGTDVATFTGKFVDVLAPDPDTICIEDIAHHLSMLSRYGGATDRFYSVAEHSVRVYLLARSQSNNPNSQRHLMLGALLHDGAEAYLQDVASPVKFAMRIEEMESIVGPLTQPYEEHMVLKNWRGVYGKLTDRMDRAIAAALNIRPLFDEPLVRLCDMWALRIEARAMLPDRGENWRWEGELPNDGEIPDDWLNDWMGGLGWSQYQAERQFMLAWDEIARPLS